MNSKSTWTLVTIALGLFAFIFFFERHVQIVPPAPGPLLPGLSVRDVTSVRVRPAGQAEIRADRTNEGWRLTHPVVYPAEPLRVRELLEVLHVLTRQRSITSEELRRHQNPQAEFGFDKPQFDLIIEQGTHRPELLVGNKTRRGDEVYLQVVGSDGIFLADARLLPLFPRSHDEWRDRSIVSLKDFTIDHVSVTNGTRVLMEFKRDVTNKLWRMLRPVEDVRADSPRLERALADLDTLRITSFVPDDPKADLAAYGLRPSAFDLALAQGTNPPYVVLSFGSSPTNDSSQVYFRRSDRDGVSLVPGERLATWQLNHVELRDRQLVSLAEGSVDRIQVLGEGAFTLDQTSNDVWSVTAPENFPAEPALVRRFLGLLSSLRIAQFYKDVVQPDDLQKSGLNQPVRQYLLSVADTNSPGGRRMIVQIDCGGFSEDRENVYVRRTNENRIYAIRRDSYNELHYLSASGLTVREQKLWNFTTNEVARVTTRRLGKLREVIRDVNGNWSLGPATTGSTKDFSPLALDYTVESLGHLRSMWWVDRGAENRKNYGITDDSLQIEVELRRGDKVQKLSVELGGTSPVGHQYAATTVDGQFTLFEFPMGTYRLVLDSLDPVPKPP